MSNKTGTIKDAEALAAKIKYTIVSIGQQHDPTITIQMTAESVVEIQSALTAAEQRGFERGKADVVPSGDATALAEKIGMGISFDTGSFDIVKGAKLIEAYRAAVRAEGERNAVPDGWQLVPKEPTDAMCADATTGWHSGSGTTAQHLYKMMLAAAPSPASKEEEK